MRARYGYDCVWSLFYVGKEAEMFGCREILFSADGPPNVSDFVIKSWDDIARLEVPEDVTAHPAWTETARCLAVLRAEVGATHPICAYITASTSLPALLMGMEKWMELLLFGPADLRDELLRKCSDYFQKAAAAYRDAGANVLLYSSPFGSLSMVGKRQFLNTILPWMRRDLAPGGADGIVYYCGMAPFNNVIQQVIDELNVRIHYISPLADLGEALAIVGDQGLTCGVIDDARLLRGSPDQTRAEVQRMCELGKPSRRFLLGTGLIPMSVPPDAIQCMVEAALEHGSYR
jgi:uroporphyrinogen decarboxylase